MQPSGGAPTPSGFGAGPSEGPSATEQDGPPPLAYGKGKAFNNRTPNPPQWCGRKICIYDPRDIWRDVNRRDDGLYVPN
jgi:hypothetical protein